MLVFVQAKDEVRTLPNLYAFCYEQNKAKARRQRIASLTNAVAPKGWEPTRTRSAGSLSPISPVQRSVPKPEVWIVLA